MSLTSVEGLVIALLFVVPGASGVGLRDYVWAGKPLSAFDQVVLALTYSTGALILLELSTGLIGLSPELDGAWAPI